MVCQMIWFLLISIMTLSQYLQEFGTPNVIMLKSKMTSPTMCEWLHMKKELKASFSKNDGLRKLPSSYKQHSILLYNNICSPLVGAYVPVCISFEDCSSMLISVWPVCSIFHQVFHINTKIFMNEWCLYQEGIINVELPRNLKWHLIFAKWILEKFSIVMIILLDWQRPNTHFVMVLLLQTFLEQSWKKTKFQYPSIFSILFSNNVTYPL